MSTPSIIAAAPTPISTKDLAAFLQASPAFARAVMAHLDIPKRGGGYSRRRLLDALGFVAPFPLEETELWRPLLDVPAAAAMAGVSEKTVGRLLEGTHADKTLTAYVHLGPRKRLVFPFELASWLNGEPTRFKRDPSRMHPALRNPKLTPGTPPASAADKPGTRPKPKPNSVAMLLATPSGAQNRRP